MNTQYDEGIIRLFADKDKKEGLLFKLARPARRDEVISAMGNAIQFAPRCMTEILKKPKVDELHSQLKARSAGDKAYIFGWAEELHGQIIPLREALEMVVGSTKGTLVYCIEGQVGYYEADGWEGYFIIHKSQK